MRQGSGIRYLAVVLGLLFLAACSQTYPYIPSTTKTVVVPPAEGETPPGPAAAAPPPSPPADLAPQVRALETRVQQLESRLAEVERTRVATAPAPAPAPAKVSGYPAGDKVYQEGLRLYQGKKYDPAREKFSQYLKDQPQGPKAAEARYHLADSFYQEGKYKEAAVEFNKMATQHPRSILAPAALLRQALAYKSLQQTANYQSTLKKLAQAYPKSPEAKEAKKWLREGKKEEAR
jgi:tol-pal system protein YbgF